jgi:hypothetical protein
MSSITRRDFLNGTASRPEHRSAMPYFAWLFIRSIANSRQKLMRLVVRIKELLRAPGTL